MADDADVKVTYATPFGSFVALSMGIWTYIRAGNGLVAVQTKHTTREIQKGDSSNIFPEVFSSSRRSLMSLSETLILETELGT